MAVSGGENGMVQATVKRRVAGIIAAWPDRTPMRTFRAIALAIAIATHAALAIAQQPEEFQSCLSQLRGLATANGIRSEVFDTALRNVEVDADVLESMDRQPEFSL